MDANLRFTCSGAGALGYLQLAKYRVNVGRHSRIFWSVVAISPVEVLGPTFGILLNVESKYDLANFFITVLPSEMRYEGWPLMKATLLRAMPFHLEKLEDRNRILRAGVV